MDATRVGALALAAAALIGRGAATGALNDGALNDNDASSVGRTPSLGTPASTGWRLPSR